MRSDLPDAAELDGELRGYFPAELRDRLAAQIATHPLRREITATVVTNDLVNRAGMTFVDEMRSAHRPYCAGGCSRVCDRA